MPKRNSTLLSYGVICYRHGVSTTNSVSLEIATSVPTVCSGRASRQSASSDVRIKLMMDDLEDE